MSSPYPPLPDGVAPIVDNIRSEFARIDHDIKEAVRGYPHVTLPAPPAQDLNFIRPGVSTTVPTSAFTGPWSNFGAPFAPAAYEITGTRVSLRGTVKTSVNLTGAYGIYYLPTGFRPVNQEPFICTIGGGGAIRVDVYPNGGVAIADGTSILAGAYLSLSGISFSTLA